MLVPDILRQTSHKTSEIISEVFTIYRFFKIVRMADVYVIIRSRRKKTIAIITP